MNRIVFVAVLILAAVAVSVPLLANAGSNEYESVDHYIHTMCSAQRGHMALAFAIKRDGREGMGANKVATEIVRRWEANLALFGMPGYRLSREEKGHILAMTEEVLSGKWKSPDEMMYNCTLTRKGVTFPKHLYGDLGGVEKEFNKKGASVVRASQKK